MRYISGENECDLVLLSAFIVPSSMLSTHFRTDTATVLLLAPLQLGALIAAVVCGYLSDKWGRRKPFVYLGSLLMGAVTTGMAFYHNLYFCVLMSFIIGM